MLNLIEKMNNHTPKFQSKYTNVYFKIHQCLLAFKKKKKPHEGNVIVHRFKLCLPFHQKLTWNDVLKNIIIIGREFKCPVGPSEEKKHYFSINDTVEIQNVKYFSDVKIIWNIIPRDP